MSRKKRHESEKKINRVCRKNLARRGNRRRISTRGWKFSRAHRVRSMRTSDFAICSSSLFHKFSEHFASSHSTLDYVQRKACEAGLLVARLHIEAGEIHGANHLVERDLVRFGLVHRQARGLHGFGSAHGIALDARNLHQTADGIAGHAEVVLHGDLSSVLDLAVVASESRRQSRRGHGAGHAYFSLAPNLRAADGRVLL